MGLMESMASHVPVVSTPVGMGPDLIEEGVTGWLAPVEPDAIATAALAALDRPAPERGPEGSARTGVCPATGRWWPTHTGRRSISR